MNKKNLRVKLWCELIMHISNKNPTRIITTEVVIPRPTMPLAADKNARVN